MKLRHLFLTLVILLFPLTVQAQTNASQQYGFAHQLMEDGDKALSLLEFKRFLYLHKNHNKTPDALFYTAELYLNFVGDINRAKTYYARLSDEHRRHPLGRKAEDRLDFIEINSDYGGKPLRTFFIGKALAGKGSHNSAADKFRSIFKNFPRASLADDAMLELAKLNLDHLEKVENGERLLQRIRSDYPRSPLLGEVAFWDAVVIEKRRGPGEEALNAYHRVMDTAKEPEVRKMAEARYNELVKQVDRIERRFEERYVVDYKVKKQEYSHQERDLYLVDIEIQSNSSERSVKATLEDALITHGADRKRRDDRVAVTAYYNYPYTTAGEVSWRMGEDPLFRLTQREEPKSDDVFKDILIDILR